MNEERAVAAIEHLQAAALELIESARAALDVAEDLVKDPVDLLALAATAAEFAQRFATPATASRAAADDDAPPKSGVTRIRVS